MEKIAALRLFVPLTVLLLCIMVLVPYILQETVHSGHDAGHKRGLFSRRADIGAGADCTDQHEHQCGPHTICQNQTCKIQAGQQCTRDNQTCVNGAQCRQPTVTVTYKSALSTTTAKPTTTTTTKPTTTTTPAPTTTTPAPPTTTPAPPTTTTTTTTPAPTTTAPASTTQFITVADAPAAAETTSEVADSTPNGPDICLCDAGLYHNTTDDTCETRILLGEHCGGQEHGHSPCVEPNKTVCHDNTCQCHEDYASTNNRTCTPRFLVGESGCTDYTQHNPPDNDCVENANCDNNNKCVCQSDYYQSNTKHCEKRIAPGQSCDNANASHDEITPCMAGASCNKEGICECYPFYYKLNGSGSTATCSLLIKVGMPCQSPELCVANAHCSQSQSQGVCECNQDYFKNDSFDLCEHKKPAMTPCGESVECVDDAHCVGGICVCDEHFYDHQQRCNKKLSMGHVCDGQVPGQCLINGECVHAHCRCNDKSFDNEGANCPLTLKVGEACNWYNHDSRQCQSNTTCVFRPSDNNPMCGCDIDHFFNSEYCVKRALAGDPCPYETRTSMGLSMENDEFLKQCVENAHCEDTYKVCKCNDDHYNRAGRCPLQIAVDGYCDPWTDNIDQCASNAQCVFGRCVGGVTGAPVVG